MYPLTALSQEEDPHSRLHCHGAVNERTLIFTLYAVHRQTYFKSVQFTNLNVVFLVHWKLLEGQLSVL